MSIQGAIEISDCPESVIRLQQKVTDASENQVFSHNLGKKGV